MRPAAQVLHCLRGVVVNGPALRRSTAGRHPRLEPVPGVYTRQLSVGALGAVLEQLAQAASAGLRCKQLKRRLPARWD